MSSENSAHRIAVEWEDDHGDTQEGVFVPRRDTDSRMNALAGGRAFPGVHHHSKFTVADRDGRISMRIVADDIEQPLVELEASETEVFPEASVFPSLRHSSEFFEAGCIGYSTRPDSCTLDGLLLKVSDWRVSPLSVHCARSAYYDDRSIFPEGSIELDHALLMRDIPHEWHSEPTMRSDEPKAKTRMTKPLPLWSRSFEASTNINPEVESALSAAAGIALTLCQNHVEVRNPTQNDHAFRRWL
ncbi:MAG: hypothetical protein ACI9R3_002579 [Verrucomicrobiales bacterium]